MTNIIWRIAENYWKAAHHHKRHRVREDRGFVGNAAENDYTYCIPPVVMEIDYWRMLLCSWLKLDPESTWPWLDDLDQYPDEYQFYSAVEYYLTKKENEEMNKFPELEPNMLVMCENGRGIHDYFLITRKAGESYEAYRLDVMSTGDVILASRVSVRDFPEQAIAVYAGGRANRTLSPEVIAMIADGDAKECARWLIWERGQKPLEVTMEEVCEKFGQEVKIVKEK